MRAEPIDCFRPTRERAAEFSAMPYDVYDRSSVITHLRVHPRSFLAIDYPSSQFPADHDMYAPDVYERARELLNERVVDGTRTSPQPERCTLTAGRRTLPIPWKPPGWALRPFIRS